MAAGFALLWPGEAGPGIASTAGAIEPATVVAVEGGNAQLVEIELESGERGSVVVSRIEGGPAIEAGDAVRVARVQPGTYAFIDFERRTPLALLAIVFVVLVLALGRLHGLRALAGLAVSIVILLAFVVPAINAGEPALAVAIVGSLAVMLATIALSHGLGIKSAAAILGTTAALILTALLAVAAVGVAHLTGTSIVEASLLSTQGGPLSLEGLVLAGMVVGALGVLDDVTISQASTVLALHRTDPTLSLRTLVSRALAVGRDHLGATVNTLALAYAGASLPLLLVFDARDYGAGDALNSEPVATAIAAAVVGSIGLLLAVPLTTVLAGLLARAVPAGELPDEHAHHAHQ